MLYLKWVLKGSIFGVRHLIKKLILFSLREYNCHCLSLLRYEFTVVSITPLFKYIRLHHFFRKRKGTELRRAVKRMRGRAKFNIFGTLFCILQIPKVSAGIMEMRYTVKNNILQRKK